MANEMTVLTVDQVIAAIGDIDLIMNDNEAMIKELDKIIQQRLPIAWDCAAQRAYAEVYNGYKRTILPKFCQLLATYRQTLNETANNLGANDAEIEKMVHSYVVSAN